MSSVEKGVLLNAIATAGDTRYRQARLRQSVFGEQHLRTLKRSRAALRFSDGAELRVNERTELVIQPSATLRRIQLGGGAVWLRVPKGSATVVETPTVTAAVRGTEFEVTADGELRVYDGVVGFGSDGSVDVGAFQKARFVDGVVVGPEPIPIGERPMLHGGAALRWWEEIVDGRENLGSSEATPFVNVRESVSNIRFQGDVAGGGPLARQAFQLEAAGETVSSSSSLWWGIGGLALLGGGPSGASGTVSLDAMGGDASFALGTASTRLAFGNTRLEASVWNRPGLGGLSAKTEPGATFAVSRTIADARLTVGRFGLHLSPVPLDVFDQSVLSGRFSGAAIAWKKGALDLTAAWTDDVDAVAAGSQPAWVGSASAFVAGGRVGGTIVRPAGGAAAQSYGVNFSLPVLPGWLEVYGEVGDSDSRRGKHTTLGMYLPVLFERWNLDCFVEYERQDLLGEGWSAQVAYRPSEHWAWVAGAAWVGSERHVRLGVQVRF